MTVDTSQNKTERTIDHLPPALRQAIAQHVSLESVREVSPQDLDASGKYAEGYLVLTDEGLGHFHPLEGGWQGQWRGLSQISQAVIVEGLGMGLLRLSGDGKALAEYRFTLRHAKSVARLQRRLERQIEGKQEEDLPPEPPKGDEKKVRCDKCGKVIPDWSEVCPACLNRRKVLSRLLDFVKPYRFNALLGFVLMLSVTGAMLLRMYFNKPMFDEGLGTAGGKPDYAILLTYILIMGAMMVAGAVAGGFKERIMGQLASRMGRDIRDKTYAHLHKLSLSYFSKKPTGSLVTRITSDSDRIWDFVAFTAIESANSLVLLGGICALMFVLSWQLALIVLIPIPIMLALTLYFHHKLHRGFDRLFHKWSSLTSVVADALPGVRVIKAFSQEKREVSRFGDKNRDYYEDEVGMISIWTLFGPVVAFCTQVAWLLVWIVGGYWAVRDFYHPPLAGQEKMTVGTLIAFQALMWQFFGPIHTIAHIDRMFNRAATSVQRIFEILDTEPVIFSKSGAASPHALEGKIELRNVSFSYDGVRKVLRNVSLTIQPGEMIGLAGPSGGGKSTLINLICRFYDVLEGQILIDGLDVRDYEVEAMRRRIGVVLQEPFLFHGTVARNVAYGHPEASLEQIIAAAKAANAHDFIVGFPDGYDTMVGERGQSLSGGERQRISIARAILNNPKILVLDEATSSVDTETEKLIQEALDRLVADRTTIAIAHRLSTLRKADRLVILDKGEIVEQGTHDELKDKEGGTYAKLINMQSQMQSIMAIG